MIEFDPTKDGWFYSVDGETFHGPFRFRWQAVTAWLWPDIRAGLVAACVAFTIGGILGYMRSRHVI